MKSKTAIKIILAIIFAVLIFHLCIVLKVIPYDITWGGRLKNDSEMYVFESISILINLFLAWILLIKGKFVKEMIPMKVVNIVLWIFVGLFLLNTVGNVVAETNFEKWFAVLTLGISVLLGIILLKKPN